MIVVTLTLDYLILILLILFMYILIQMEVLVTMVILVIVVHLEPNLTAYLNNCSTPNSPFSNVFILLDNSGNTVYTNSTVSDSVVLPILTSR